VAEDNLFVDFTQLNNPKVYGNGRWWVEIDRGITLIRKFKDVATPTVSPLERFMGKNIQTRRNARAKLTQQLASGVIASIERNSLYGAFGQHKLDPKEVMLPSGYYAGVRAMSDEKADLELTVQKQSGEVKITAFKHRSKEPSETPMMTQWGDLKLPESFKEEILQSKAEGKKDRLFAEVLTAKQKALIASQNRDFGTIGGVEAQEQAVNRVAVQRPETLPGLLKQYLENMSFARQTPTVRGGYVVRPWMDPLSEKALDTEGSFGQAVMAGHTRFLKVMEKLQTDLLCQGVAEEFEKAETQDEPKVQPLAHLAPDIPYRLRMDLGAFSHLDLEEFEKLFTARGKVTADVDSSPRVVMFGAHFNQRPVIREPSEKQIQTGIETQKEAIERDFQCDFKPPEKPKTPTVQVSDPKYLRISMHVEPPTGLTGNHLMMIPEDD
jgi:hypothetical protein